MKKENDRFVMLTTSDRGVFAGVLEEHDLDRKRATLNECRMCVYWPANNRGVMGLASDGPKSGAKITPAVPKAEIENVTMVCDCTPRAVKMWRAEPWG